jgi:multiple antibiotic resistance protein
MPAPSETQFALLAFSSLFSVINPISAAPIFVALTSGSPADRRRAAVRACLTALVVLAVFAAAGGAIFAFFGITVPAFQIAGGLIFALMSIRTLEDGPDELSHGDVQTPDPSVVPLGIPVIAGPGAISTVMILIGQAQDPMRRFALGGAILVNILLTFVILLAAPAIVSWIGATGQRIVSKVMGLITAVIGVQFVINGVTTVFVDILRSVRTASGP